jgi:hypothetical protein
MNRVGARRRVLLVGVGDYPAAPDDRELDADEDVYDVLPFAPERIVELAGVFESYTAGGFEVQMLLDPDRDQLRDAINGLFDDKRVTARVVHVIAHSRHDSSPGDRLEVATRCLTFGENNVSEWQSRAMREAAPTLFLVDMCNAGRAATRSGTDRDGQIRSMVIAASRADEKAYNGTFSQVLADVLRECVRSGLGHTELDPLVSLDVLVRRVRDGVKGQRVTTTEVQLGLDDPPFLPNPRYVDDPDVLRKAQKVKELEPSLRPFVAEVADLDHFRTRAGEHFTGRKSELERLVPWLDGRHGGGLYVVTGTAGVGKSALLGALVCAAHPELASITPNVASALPLRPRVNNLLVAVHARQRRLDEITVSIAAQLGLEWHDDRRDATQLIEMIVAMPTAPVIVLDALDECPDSSAVQAVLLLPLANALRSDGATACQLLVGVRPWREFEPLTTAAEKRGGLIDLDLVEPDVLQRDLRAFVGAVLRGKPFAERLALGVATKLVDDFRRRRDLPPEARQGQFLVASRYADYLVRHPISDELDAGVILDQMPIELPDVLELEVSESEDPQRLRATLAALAYAKGDGMPQEVAHVIAAAIGGQATDMLMSEAARLYLRMATERDGTCLYRLYHQGLADYLRRYPLRPLHEEPAERRVFDAILATRSDGVRAWWESAPPYLKRHAIQHAVDASAVDELLIDPEFLVHADLAPLIQELDHATSEPARLAAAVYRASHHLFHEDAESRRRLLLLNAARYQATELFHGLKGAMTW